MLSTVNVFTAGDHFGGYEKPAEAQHILETLLNHAGYTKHNWECRVDKQRHCSSISRPVRVIGYKSYGVVLRVKPDVNSTIDYQMTLLIPEGSGYSAKNLFDQLQANEKSISRLIRKEEKPIQKEKVVTTPSLEALGSNILETVFPPKEAPEPKIESNGKPEEFRPEFPNLRLIVKYDDKLKYILEKVQEVNNFNFCRTKAQFIEALRHECKLTNHITKAVSRMLSEFVKHEYLMEVINDRDKLIGYTLTEKAKSFLSGRPKVAAAVISKKEEPKLDIPMLLINIREKLQELADVANKINSNNMEKLEMLRKIEQIDKDNEELAKIISQNRESQEVFSKLGQFINPLQLHGVRH